MVPVMVVVFGERTDRLLHILVTMGIYLDIEVQIAIGRNPMY